MKIVIVFLIAVAALLCEAQYKNGGQSADVFISKSPEQSSNGLNCYGITCNPGTTHCRARVNRGPNEQTWSAYVECQEKNGNVINSGQNNIPAPFDFANLQGYSTGAYSGSFSGNGGSDSFSGTGNDDGSGRPVNVGSCSSDGRSCSSSSRSGTGSSSSSSSHSN